MINLGSFPPQPNAADWTDTIRLVDDETGTAWDLTDSLIELEVTDDRDNDYRRVFGSTTQGEIVLEPDVGFTFAFPAERIRCLCPGSYTVRIRITDNSTGFVAEPIIADLPIIDGGYR